jgi:hypothetical protein
VIESENCLQSFPLTTKEEEEGGGEGKEEGA